MAFGFDFSVVIASLGMEWAVSATGECQQCVLHAETLKITSMANLCLFDAPYSLTGHDFAQYRSRGGW